MAGRITESIIENGLKEGVLVVFSAVYLVPGLNSDFRLIVGFEIVNPILAQFRDFRL